MTKLDNVAKILASRGTRRETVAGLFAALAIGGTAVTASAGRAGAQAESGERGCDAGSTRCGGRCCVDGLEFCFRGENGPAECRTIPTTQAPF